MSWQRDRSASAGLVAVKGTAGQIRVGSLIQGRTGKLDDVWEVLEQRSPEQFDVDTTPWLRVVSRTSGDVAPVPPRPTSHPVTFMVPEDTVDPEDEKPKLDPDDVAEHTPLADQEQADLLREQLGATLLAAHDRETGVILCPPFEESGFNRETYHQHLEVAHGLDLSGIDPNDVATFGTIHGKAHQQGSKRGRGADSKGFPHLHPYGRMKHPFKGQDY